MILRIKTLLNRYLPIQMQAFSPKMTAVAPHAHQNFGPVHPPKVDKQAIKPSIAKHVQIPVKDPLDHEAPAIIHEPRSYNAKQAKSAAVILVSGAGGGVSGPSGIYLPPTGASHPRYTHEQRNLPLVSRQTCPPNLNPRHSARLQATSADRILHRRHSCLN